MEEIPYIDNIQYLLINDLDKELDENTEIVAASESFSVYAYEVMESKLQKVKSFHFIYTKPTFTKEEISKKEREFYIPKLKRERNLYGSDFEIKLRNKLEQKAIARQCAQWIKSRAKFKTNISGNSLRTFLIIKKPDALWLYSPFDNFSTTELGLAQGNDFIRDVDKIAGAKAKKRLEDFVKFWNDEKNFSDVTDTVLENVGTVYKENAPEFIYYVTLYNIFHEFLDDISEDVLPNEATGFKNSLIWNKLYDFQKDAVLSIINKLEKYNGCILADSVGLGKTFSALAVIKYYENRNKSVLVLCPKKLNNNWVTYKSNYKNNPIAADRLRYDVFFHSDLSRNGGTTNGLELDNINWSNYDLVVIDESHNFRNGGKTSTDEDEIIHENRYSRLLNRVIKGGVKTKVLMLSATPVNNGFNDLKNQLQLAYEGDAANIDGLLNTSSSIDTVFRQAQKAYNIWAKQPESKRKSIDLVEKLPPDFFKILDSVTIARSRKHIERYYNIDEIGKFPTKLAPVSQRPTLTNINKDSVSYKNLSRLIEQLNLSIYTPSLFIQPSCMDKYATDSDSNEIGAGLTIGGREKGLRRLMAINLLKRLESSVYAFLLTISRINELIAKTITAIDKHQTAIEVEAFDTENLSEDDFDEESVFGKRKVSIAIDDMDAVSWKRELENDNKILDEILNLLQEIPPEHDNKLQQLKKDIEQKIKNPINGTNKKIIIFSAFADTASYLYNQIAENIKANHGLNSALVTGDEVKSTIKTSKKQKLDFNTILTLFSPVSKERDLVKPGFKDDIDILFATDCISEGQNLQDCDYLINYDIHWNPVRIIQRFGRIDRIGSSNDKIQLVNYWPDVELDEYIKLKARVETRMKISVITSTGDGNIINPEENLDLQYRREQLQRLQKEVVDLEDLDTGINIMDLGLNEFRMDLVEYNKKNPDLDHTPFGLEAVVYSNGNAPQGVVFVLKNRNSEIDINSKNVLHPFYLVYVSSDKTIVYDHLSAKKILDTMRGLCKNKSVPDKELCNIIRKETNDGENMSKYSDMLQSAIQSIIAVNDKSDTDSFLDGDNGNLFANEIKGLDDFELICFLIVR